MPRNDNCVVVDGLRYGRRAEELAGAMRYRWMMRLRGVSFLWGDPFTCLGVRTGVRVPDDQAVIAGGPDPRIQQTAVGSGKGWWAPGVRNRRCVINPGNDWRLKFTEFKRSKVSTKDADDVCDLLTEVKIRATWEVAIGWQSCARWVG